MTLYQRKNQLIDDWEFAIYNDQKGLVHLSNHIHKLNFDENIDEKVVKVRFSRFKYRLGNYKILGEFQNMNQIIDKYPELFI